MPTCPAGHQTANTDFCDTCGLPVDATQIALDEVSAQAVDAVKTLECPNCHTENLPQALFCEACGYDFETGQVPDNPWAKSSVASASPVEAAIPAPAASPADGWALAAASPVEAATPEVAAAPVEAATPPGDASPAPVAGATDSAPVAAPADDDQTVPLNWVAELWIDPDWYELQGSPDPLPSAGLPDIVPLVRTSNLIGRMSVSREIYPQIDCELDTGVSRRHAMLTTDWTRWWIEDLDSANGTFVGDAAGPLPSMPIPRGRVELTIGQRIYVGAWTRIVVREATQDEKQALGA